ncbi:MAG: PKD domain-containing protein [Candidatus Omnitrophota bacterium]
MKSRWICFYILTGLITTSVFAKPFTVDMAVGEIYFYHWKTPAEKRIKVVSYKETRDEFRNAVRQAEVLVEVDGVQETIPVAQYSMPKIVNGVKLDAPITKGYLDNSGSPEIWDLAPGKDVRLRVWDSDQSLLEPGTFCYPVKQRWFASETQMANEPTFVDGGEDPRRKDIYYHYALDFGGYDLLVPIVAATDGEIVSVAGDAAPWITKELYPFVEPRYDVVYIRDGRGWFYRYSHFSKILPHVKVGQRVKMGDWIGILGKEGASGGWSHLHFGVHGVEGDERGLINGYPFIVEAYLREHPGSLLAVARPHQLVKTGDVVRLDGSNSICDGGEIVSYDWQFHDGTTAQGPIAEKTYDKPGVYSEILRIQDNRGQIDADFAVVHVLAATDALEHLPPSIHAAYYPTFGIKAGGVVYFKARTFRVDGGKEQWDFGDGTSGETCSQDEFATISHHYNKPGLYIVTVRRDSANGTSAAAQLKVMVEEKK